MDMQKLLTDRFVQAIKKSFAPCPLIGPKWFRLLAEDRPPRFCFSGSRKLAKATKDSPEAIVQRLLDNLDLSDLEVNVRTAKNWDVNVFFSGPLREAVQ